MAIDNSLYNSLENTYTKIKDYFDTIQLGREHSQMIIKHEELADLLERLDIEAIEEQSSDIHGLHEQLNNIKEVSEKIAQDLDTLTDPIVTTTKVVEGLDEIFLKITPMIV